MEEVWRGVTGFPGYDVSGTGQVRSWRIQGDKYGRWSDQPRLLRLQKNGNGYLFVWLCRVGQKPSKGLVHRLVARAFLEGNNQEVAHWNGDRSDNRVDNLRWASVKENQADRIRHGTYGTKLSESDVEAIRSMYIPGEITQQEIALKFNIAQTHVSRIIRRGSWSDE